MNVNELHKNEVELVGYYGSDETHALSAWVSTRRELSEERKNRLEPFLKKLAEEGHHTPFEKSFFHFVIKTDIATHIHILKHRIAVSVNAESARYKEFREDKFYIPDDWPEDLRERLKQHCEESFKLYHDTLKELEKRGITRKRAKESARFFLPYATQICQDVSFNFRSLMHFVNLRMSEHAQKEVREIAQKMIEEIKNIPGNPFKYSLKAFGLIETS